MSNRGRCIARHRLFVAALGLGTATAASACAATTGPSPQPAPGAQVDPANPDTDAQATPATDWVHNTAELGSAHALVGKIWSTSEARFVESAALVGALSEADYALLGETHDNADHHRLQAWLVQQLAPGRQAVVYEMIESAQQDKVDTALSTAPQSEPKARAVALAAALDWANSGWPSFELYRPVFEAGLAAGLAVAGAGVSRETLAPLFRGEPVDSELAARYGIDQPLDPDTQTRWLDEMALAHCGAMPAAALTPMLTAQRLRDASMAAALSEHERAILIAGNGHTRADRAVPAYMPDQKVAGVAFVEVSKGQTDAAAYDEGSHAFLWFTPRAPREDPCEAFIKQREAAAKAHEGAEQAEPEAAK